MKKNRKIYIAAAACIAIGLILTAGAIMVGGRPGVSLGSDGIRMLGDKNRNDYILEKTELEEFSSVKIDLEYGNFYLIPSDGYYLEYCLSGSSRKPEYEVKNDTLVFHEKPVVNYVQFQIMNFGVFDSHEPYYVNLYVPEDVYFESFGLNSGSGDSEVESLKGKTIDLNLAYGNLSVDTLEGEVVSVGLDSGNLKAGEVTGEQSLDIQMAYGDLAADTLKAGEMKIRSSSGNMAAEEAIADSTAKISADYGNISFTDCKAGNLNIQLASGDFSAQDLEAEILELSDSYGNVKAGNCTVSEKGKLTLDSGNLSLGTCKAGDMEVSLSYGDLVIQEMDGKSLTVDNSDGNIKINGLRLEMQGKLSLDSGNAEVALGEDAYAYTMKLETDYGSIHVPGAGSWDEDDGQSYRQEAAGTKGLEIYCSDGDIRVTDNKG